jgi:hypothetical protein
MVIISAAASSGMPMLRYYDGNANAPVKNNSETECWHLPCVTLPHDRWQYCTEG